MRPKITYTQLFNVWSSFHVVQRLLSGAIVFQGLPVHSCAGEVVASLSRRLVMEGVARERVLFCDFF